MDEQIKTIESQLSLNSHSGHRWETLTDTEKARVLLGTIRLLDSDAFLTEFGSWEQPDSSITELFNS